MEGGAVMDCLRFQQGHGGRFSDPNLAKKSPSYIVDKDYAIWQDDCRKLLKELPRTKSINMVWSSPPYNVGKCYENNKSINEYLDFHKEVIDEIIPRMDDDGIVCWQVGFYVNNKTGEIVPLEYFFYDMFKKHGLIMKNRIIWHYRHGLTYDSRFAGRHETIMVMTKGDHNFNVDPVRMPQIYKNKKKNGKLTCNPLGKNPGDVWDNIPNVKASHPEKIDLYNGHTKTKEKHPCQTPVGLVERCLLSMTKPKDLILDPFAGTGSIGVAAAIHGRRFWGCEISAKYAIASQGRINQALRGEAMWRPHNKPIKSV